MHRSQLAAAVVDISAGDFDREVEFWSGALGRRPEDVDDNPEYRDLGQPFAGLQFLLQKVDDAARVHLDIETDDVDAEVERLEALGGNGSPRSGRGGSGSRRPAVLRGAGPDGRELRGSGHCLGVTGRRTPGPPEPRA